MIFQLLKAIDLTAHNKDGSILLIGHDTSSFKTVGLRVPHSYKRLYLVPDDQTWFDTPEKQEIFKTACRRILISKTNIRDVQNITCTEKRDLWTDEECLIDQTNRTPTLMKMMQIEYHHGTISPSFLVQQIGCVENFNNLPGTRVYALADDMTMMERFLVDNNIKGPCLISLDKTKLSAPKNGVKITSCMHEFICPSEALVSSENNNNNDLSSFDCHHKLKVMSIKWIGTTTTTMNKETDSISSISSQFEDGGGYKKTVFPNLYIISISFYNLGNGPLYPSSSSSSSSSSSPESNVFPKIYTMSWSPGFSKEQNWPKNVTMYESEGHMIQALFNRISCEDPDIIVGLKTTSHRWKSFYNHALAVISKDVPGVSIPSTMSQIGRMSNYTGGSYGAGVGRLWCDFYKMANEFIKIVDLSSIAQKLGVSCPHSYDPIFDIQKLATSRSVPNDKSILNSLSKSNEDELQIVMCALSKFSFLQITRQLSLIHGVSWTDTLELGVKRRAEMHLFNEFHVNKFICSSRLLATKKSQQQQQKQKFKDSNNNSSSSNNNSKEEREEENNEEDMDKSCDDKSGTKRKRVQFEGGLNIEPEVGFHNDGFIMFPDFTSQYPSIIQEYGLCLSNRRTWESLINYQVNDENPDQFLSLVEETMQSVRETSVVAKIQKYLAGQRKIFKTMATPLSAIIAQCYKIAGNGLYGAFANKDEDFTGFRFLLMAFSQIVAKIGRCELKSAILFIQREYKLKLIYGDTDSCGFKTMMTHLDSAISKATEICNKINSRRRVIRLDAGAFATCMAIYRKKKYWLMGINPKDGSIEFETTGTESSKRDYCHFTHMLLNRLCKYILCKDMEGIENLIKSIYPLMVDLIKSRDPTPFIVYNELKKDVHTYPINNTQPQIICARMLASIGIEVRPKDNIPFLICNNSKICHPAEYAAKNSPYNIDISVYMDKQILRPFRRLCEILDGSSQKKIDEWIKIYILNV